jgi:hypothetical protein
MCMFLEKVRIARGNLSRRQWSIRIGQQRVGEMRKKEQSARKSKTNVFCFKISLRVFLSIEIFGCKNLDFLLKFEKLVFLEF